MIIAPHLHSLSDFLPHWPQRQIRHLRTHLVGVVQYGLMALAMFGMSAVAGAIAGVVVGVFR